MNKLLIVLPYQIADQKGFDAIINGFERRGYQVNIFNDINRQNFRIDVLPVIIESIKSSLEDIEKVVVISNIMGAIFTWYRCYNSLVNDYIYYIDDNLDTSSLFKTIQDYPFLVQLINFNGIKNEEHLEGKIYLNINSKNYFPLFNLLLSNGNFRYFDKLDNFGFETNKTKQAVIKEYHYNGKIYRFNLPGSPNIKTVSCSLVDQSNSNAININLEFLKQLDDNLYFLPFIMKEFYKSKVNNCTTLLINYFQSWQEKSITERQKFCFEVLNYIEQQRPDFQEKIFFLFLIDQLKVDQGRIFQMIMKALLEDNDHLDFHYPILANTLRFLSIMNFEVYDSYYLERRVVLQRIADHFKGGVKLKTQRNLNNKRIAIHIGQLLGLTHSPTKVTLDYAKAIKQLYPDYSIKIFVEDYLYYLPTEILMPIYIISSISQICQSQHVGYLEGEEIDISYSNTKLTKKERLHQMVKEIVNFDPELIFTVDDLSLTLETIHSAYPIVHMSLGGISTSIADLYLYGVREPAVKDNERFKTMNPEDIYEFKWGIILPKVQKKFNRHQYNLGNNDFVLVTVGNRLQQEMSDSYLDFIVSFLKKDQRIKWLIVGTSEIPYLKANYCEIYTEQIIMIQYEADLAGIYGICDVFVNPPRDGGGFSIAIAMNEGVPVVAFNTSYSCIGYMGKDNCCGSRYEDYFKELERLYHDKIYWQTKSNLMKELIQEFDIDKTARQFMEYFQLAKERFVKRTQLSTKK